MCTLPKGEREGVRVREIYSFFQRIDLLCSLSFDDCSQSRHNPVMHDLLSVKNFFKRLKTLNLVNAELIQSYLKVGVGQPNKQTLCFRCKHKDFV